MKNKEFGLFDNSLTWLNRWNFFNQVFFFHNSSHIHMYVCMIFQFFFFFLLSLSGSLIYDELILLKLNSACLAYWAQLIDKITWTSNDIYCTFTYDENRGDTVRRGRVHKDGVKECREDILSTVKILCLLREGKGWLESSKR